MTIDLEQFKGHTPGPWKLTRRDGLPHGDSTNLGWDWDMDNPPEEPHRGVVSLEADARLIAAAPALLSEVRRLKEALEPFAKAANDQDKARAASAFLADQRASQMRSLGFAEDDLIRARSALSPSPVEKEG